MSDEELLKLATKFEFGTVYFEGEYPFRLAVEHRGGHAWVVTGDATTVLSKSGNWLFEPSPSNRSEPFISNTRYTREEAIAKAKELVTSSLSEEDWVNLKR